MERCRNKPTRCSPRVPSFRSATASSISPILPWTKATKLSPHFAHLLPSGSGSNTRLRYDTPSRTVGKVCESLPVHAQSIAAKPWTELRVEVASKTANLGRLNQRQEAHPTRPESAGPIHAQRTRHTARRRPLRIYSCYGGAAVVAHGSGQSNGILSSRDEQKGERPLEDRGFL